MNLIVVGVIALCSSSQAAEGDDRWDSRFGSVLDDSSRRGGDGSQLAMFQGQLHRSGKAVSRWDGAAWQVMGETDGSVGMLLATKTALYAAGSFTTMAGVSARNIAAWDGKNWQALDSRNTNALGNSIVCLTADREGTPIISSAPGDFQRDGKAYIWKWGGKAWQRLGDGHRFGSIEKIAAGKTNVFASIYYEGPGTEAGWGRRLVELVAGKWRLLRRQPAKYGVHCMVVAENDELIVGGELYDNPQLGNLARWNGKDWKAVGGGIKGYPLVLVFDGGHLIVAGNVTGAGDVSSRGLLRWTGKTWQGFADGFSGGGTMYATGEKECVAFDMTSIGSIAVDGERLFAAGNFTRAGNSGATGLAMWNGREWQSLNSASQQGVNGKISSLVVIGTNLFAAGEFAGAGGLAVSGLAKWDGHRWESLGAPLMPGPRAGAATDGTNLFVTGSGPNAELFEWNHVAWKRHGLTGTAWARGLAVRSGQMLVGGYGICQVSNSTHAELPGSAQLRGGSVDAIAFGSDGIVYAAGNFQGTLPRTAPQRRPFDNQQNALPGAPSPHLPWRRQVSNFAIWNGKEWSDADAGIGEYISRVRVIVPRGSNVYVGGSFLRAGRERVNGLARWDGERWHDVGGGVTGDGDYYAGNYWMVSAIAFHGNDIYVGGHFSQAGGRCTGE